jgi:hypothetical protein
MAMAHMADAAATALHSLGTAESCSGCPAHNQVQPLEMDAAKQHTLPRAHARWYQPVTPHPQATQLLALGESQQAEEAELLPLCVTHLRSTLQSQAPPPRRRPRSCWRWVSLSKLRRLNYSHSVSHRCLHPDQATWLLLM